MVVNSTKCNLPQEKKKERKKECCCWKVNHA